MNHVISNEKLSVTISSVGAEIMSIKSGETEYLWNGDAKYWGSRSPILFPYVGRFTDGKYRCGSKAYPMEIHGFARKLEFNPEIHTDQKAIEFSVSDTPETYAIYPFNFDLSIKYVLVDNTLDIRYSVKNNSRDTMYFGIGGHPGFNVPLEDGLDFTDYYLEFSDKHVPMRVGVTDSGYLNGCDKDFPLKDGRVLPLNHSMFDNDAIVLKNAATSLTLKSDKSSRSVTVSYSDMPYLGLWHVPKTKAPYICIEPWASLPSRLGVVEDFRFKSDLIRLKEYGTYLNDWSISLV